MTPNGRGLCDGGVVYTQPSDEAENVGLKLIVNRRRLPPLAQSQCYRRGFLKLYL